jgi:hypothetical protein
VTKRTDDRTHMRCRRSLVVCGGWRHCALLFWVLLSPTGTTLSKGSDSSRRSRPVEWCNSGAVSSALALSQSDPLELLDALNASGPKPAALLRLAGAVLIETPTSGKSQTAATSAKDRWPRSAPSPTTRARTWRPPELMAS